jgi:hypothetical protein
MAKPETYCIIELGGQGLVLPTDVAMQLFPLLCQAEEVTYDWSAQRYKRTQRQTSVNNMALKQFTTAQYAELALNSD